MVASIWRGQIPGGGWRGCDGGEDGERGVADEHWKMTENDPSVPEGNSILKDPLRLIGITSWGSTDAHAVVLSLVHQGTDYWCHPFPPYFPRRGFGHQEPPLSTLTMQLATDHWCIPLLAASQKMCTSIFPCVRSYECADVHRSYSRIFSFQKKYRSRLNKFLYLDYLKQTSEIWFH